MALYYCWESWLYGSGHKCGSSKKVSGDYIRQYEIRKSSILIKGVEAVVTLPIHQFRYTYNFGTSIMVSSIKSRRQSGILLFFDDERTQKKVGKIVGI